MRHLRNNRGAAMCLSAAVVVLAGMMLGAECTISPDDPIDIFIDPNNLDCSKSSYENFGKAFFENYCLRCHNEELKSDSERLDAPQGIDFNTLEQALPFKSRIALRAGNLGDMPPILVGGPRPSDDERRQLLEWIECGMN